MTISGLDKTVELPLSDREMLRYSRHLIMPELGIEGQQKLKADPEYRQVCRDSSRKWRSRNPGYWQQYRAAKPESVQRNRSQQRQRDLRRRLAGLANNNSALDLKSSAAGVWLLGPSASDLAKMLKPESNSQEALLTDHDVQVKEEKSALKEEIAALEQRFGVGEPQRHQEIA